MIIELEHVEKRIGYTNVLNDINLTLKSGTVYGFHGINGSGKTMLMRMIAGLILPTKGKVSIDGRELQYNARFPERMGLLIESPAFLKRYTGFQNLKFLADIQRQIDDNQIKKVMERVGLAWDDKRKYYQYSLGMQQRLGIACAVAESPALLILDEPLNALDEDGIAKVTDIILDEKANGAVVILACHDFDVLKQLSDEIIHLVAGEITWRMLKTEDQWSTL